MGDNPLSPVASSPRKLPIPGTGANTNSALKGILIKPKRILPPQPDNQKSKRPIQESAPENKSEDLNSETSNSGFNPVSKGDATSVNAGLPSNKVAVPKLQINVDRLKSFFQLQGKAVAGRDKRKTDLNENDIKSPEVNKDTKDKQAPLRSQSECGGLSHPALIRESTFYSSTSKVKEWCSSRDGDNKMTAKMATDQSLTKTLDRNIRSPSPKSNTTWDRSSSGYSSDERADPRSPPPSHSASASVSSKTETEVTNEDDASVSITGDVTDDKTDVEDNNEQDQDTLKFKEDDACTSDNSTCNLISNSVDDLLSCANDCSAVTLTPTPVGNGVESETETTGGQCENCDSLNNQGAEKNDTSSSCVNFSFDSPLNIRQPPSNSRRPVWTALSNPPGNGRIQYRKSVSESMISLRHPSRQGMIDANFDGLEVCGKSFPQATINGSAKNDNSSVNDGAKPDVGNIPEITSPTSAFSPIERPVIIIDNGLDSNGPDLNARMRSFKQPLPICRSPRDFKNIGMGLNAKLPFKDDRDIRKTLHDLSSPRRPSPGGRIVPIRARHSIHVTSATNSQPISTMDTISSQPMPTQVTALPRTSVNFGKKMWRAPSGQPENAQMRPFSPFGGTLPPAKIKEQEKKRQHSDEYD